MPTRPTSQYPRLFPTAGFCHCFYWYDVSFKDLDPDQSQRRPYLDMASFPTAKRGNLDVTGIDKLVRTRPGASFASVPMHLRQFELLNGEF